MIDIYDKTTNRLVGSITEADLQVLVDALEEESLDDRDYYIDADTIDVVADGKASDHLVKVLRDALGARDGVDIRWDRR
jgi:processive 1,2-diacylglycerol beta-glucosyltransferase